MMYITCISYGMVLSGIVIDNNVDDKSSNLLFAGGFISIVAWVCSIYTNKIT